MSSRPFESAPDPSESANVVDFSSRAAKRVGDFVKKQRPPPVDASEELKNMLIPDPPLSSLRAALVEAGYEVGEEQRVHKYNQEYVSKVLAIRTPGTRKVVFLVHVVPPILDVKDLKYQMAFDFVPGLFPDGSALIIVSEGLPDPQGTYIQIFESWGSRGEAGLDARFVSWRRIDELEEASFPPDGVALKLEIQDVLGPPAVAGGGGNGGQLGSISDCENEIAQLLEDQASSLPAGSDAYFAGLITRLGSEIPQAWSNQLNDLPTSDPRTGSLKLVKWAIKKGELPAKPRTTLIGVLMAALSVDVGGKENARLFELMQQYELLTPDEIARRRGN
jgi:hypothetical protein